MINQKNNVIWHKTNAALRLTLVKGAANGFADHTLVNEFPKSGGSWVAQLLSEALDLPFPRNRLPMWNSSILHGHYIGGTNVPETVIVWRDGRDVAVSWYYHFVVGHEKTSERAKALVLKGAGITNPENIEESFPLALAYFLKDPRFPRYSWATFVDNWAGNEKAVHVKYEDLKKDAVGELQRIIFELRGERLVNSTANEVVEKFSFKRQSGRSAGASDSTKYLRKGIVGDWKNHFSEADKTLFASLAGDQLIKLGYEKDNGWI